MTSTVSFLGLAIVTPNQVHQHRRAGNGQSARLRRDAHGPLRFVRQSLKLARDAQSFSPEQRLVLDAAIDQCDGLEQLLGEMAGLPSTPLLDLPVQRRKVSATELRKRVEDADSVQMVSISTDVLWDGADDPSLMLLVDPDLLCEMLEFLIVQSARVMSSDGFVLIGLQTRPGADSVRWSLISQGHGLSAAELEHAFNRVDDESGISQLHCRAIAALHLSPLEVRSIRGGGTEISFTTPRSGPREFASAWAQWRVQYCSQPSAIDTSSRVRTVPVEDSPADSKQIRVDTSGSVLSLAANHIRPQCDGRVTVGTISLGAAMSHSAARQFDRCFQHQLGPFEFAYRVGIRKWVWAVDADEHQIQSRIASITATAVAGIPGLRINWSAPQMLPIDSRQTCLRLSDLLTREILSESAAGGVVDKDEVRLGTAPIEPSRTATERLNEELQRLAKALQMQSRRLARQARHLRWQD